MYHRNGRPKTVSVSPRPIGFQSSDFVRYKPTPGSHSNRCPTAINKSRVTGWRRSAGGSGTSGSSRPITGSSSTTGQGIYVDYDHRYVPVVDDVLHTRESSRPVNFQEFVAHQLYRYTDVCG